MKNSLESPAKPRYFICILAGAGPSVTRVAQEAISRVLTQVLSQSYDLDDVASIAVQVTSILEDSEYFNAGWDSELTVEGNVECDASLMVSRSGRVAQSSVGCLSTVKNPSKCCLQLLNSTLKNAPHPQFLVGQGAEDFALKNSENCKPTNLVSPRALERRERALRLVNSTEIKTEQLTERFAERFADTVGIIVIAENGPIAVCSSSGGPVLKQPGRIGPAAIPGAALFVTPTSAAISSGFGEDIMTARLSERAATDGTCQLMSNIYSEVHFQEKVPYFGTVRAEQSIDGVSVEYFTSTDAMVFAYGIIGREPTLKIVKDRLSSGGCFIPWN